MLVISHHNTLLSCSPVLTMDECIKRAAYGADTQPIFPSGYLRYCSKKKILCGPKSIFVDRYYKSDVGKTVDRTSDTANKVNYDSFYYSFLIHKGFIFLQLSQILRCVTSSMYLTDLFVIEQSILGANLASL